MTDNNLLGRPIHGNIQHYANRNLAEQYSAERFIAELDKVFENERILAIRWEQYTPYFNDGEPCVFEIYEPSVKLVDSNSDEFNDGFIEEYDLSIWDSRSRQTKPNPQYLDVIESLKNLSGFSHYEVIFYENFGDPAQVTATREGFEVEFYEHD